MAAVTGSTLFLLLLPFFLQLSGLASARALISSSSSSSSTTPASTASQFLDPHNRLRKSMGLPALQWNATLEGYAKWYAGQRRGDCALTHSTSNYGENLFWGQGKGWQVGDAVAAWAAEKAYYNYRTNSCVGSHDCLHYTQMVWRTTKRLGCAKMYCNSGDTYVVCEYDPHGNVIGSRPY